MTKLLTKKNVLLISAIGTCFFLTMFVLVQKWGCKEELFFFCKDSLIWIVDLLRVFPAIFLLLLIIYKLHEEIFLSWIKLTLWWLTLTVIIYLIAPSEPQDYIKFQRDFISFISTVVYFFASLMLILYKSWKLKGVKE